MQEAEQDLKLTDNEQLIIKNWFKKHKKITKTAADSFFKHFPDLYKSCEQLLLKIPEYQTTSNILRCVNRKYSISYLSNLSENF